MRSRRRRHVGAFLVAWLGSFVLVVMSGVPASAGVEEELIKLLIKKGILTEEEYRALRRQVEQSQREPAVAEKPAPDKGAKPLFKAFGTLDNEVRWRDERDIGNGRNGSSSNAHVRRALVSADVTPVDFVVGTLALQSEYIGTDRTDQDASASATPQVDKATIQLGRDDIPVYGVFGWRVQPFGAFYAGRL